MRGSALEAILLGRRRAENSFYSFCLWEIPDKTVLHEKKDALFYGQTGRRPTILKRQSHSEVSAFTRGRGPGRILFSDEAPAERLTQSLRSMLRLETVKGARADDLTHTGGFQSL